MGRAILGASFAFYRGPRFRSFRHFQEEMVHIFNHSYPERVVMVQLSRCHAPASVLECPTMLEARWLLKGSDPTILTDHDYSISWLI